MKLALLALAMGAVLSGCATAPLTPEQIWARNLTAVQESAVAGRHAEVAELLEFAMMDSAGAVRTRAFFAVNPQVKRSYQTHLEQAVQDAARSPSKAASARQKLEYPARHDVLDAADLQPLQQRLVETVIAGNLNGTLPFIYDNDARSFPELNTPEHRRVIADRMVAMLRSGPVRPVAALMGYVEDSGGATSLEGVRIEAHLPSLNLRVAELVEVERVFPQFANNYRYNISIRAHLQTKNADRLFEDDLRAQLGNRDGAVSWIDTPGNRAITVLVERVRNDEHALPEQSQTVRYAQHEVNLMSAALLMPKNATYLYEEVSGGSSIEYGYVVTALEKGTKVDEKVVRGRETNEYRRCKDARIQNVFGGVQPAAFVANDDMRLRCSNSSNPVSLDELRARVMRRIAEAVYELKPMIQLTR